MWTPVWIGCWFIISWFRLRLRLHSPGIACDTFRVVFGLEKGQESMSCECKVLAYKGRDCDHGDWVRQTSCSDRIGHKQVTSAVINKNIMITIMKGLEVHILNTINFPLSGSLQVLSWVRIECRVWVQVWGLLDKGYIVFIVCQSTVRVSLDCVRLLTIKIELLWDAISNT